MRDTLLMDSLSHEPLPARISQGSPMWRLLISEERMLFCGRAFGMHVALAVLSVPAMYWICGFFGADRRLQVGLTLFPIFYAGGMAVGSLVTMATIPAIEYDLSRRRVLLPLGREIPISEILAVQVIEYLRKWGEDEELFTYQLNLCYIDRRKPQRIQLVECCVDEPLIRDARLMASTLGAPLQVRYMTHEALLTWESRQAPVQNLELMLFFTGILTIISYATFGLDIVRQPQWPNWNDPLWLGLLIPTFLLTVLIWHHGQRKQDRNRRLARAERASNSPPSEL